MNHEVGHTRNDVVELPAPTSWPIVLALGITLLFCGLVTHWVISLLGVCLMVPAIAGWFNEVLPHERHEGIAVSAAELSAAASAQVSHREPAESARHEIEPVETYGGLLLTGIKGGLAGAVAMTVPAAIFGLIKMHSVWFAVNLLAAGGFISWGGETDAFLAEFHLKGLLAATVIHGVTSVLVGVLYAAMLPMFPKKPILSAGLIGPLILTGLLYTSSGFVSPILNQRINWLWFVVSQVAFGLVAGYVINLELKVRTPEFRALPFAVRAGLHTDVLRGTRGEGRGPGGSGKTSSFVNSGAKKDSEIGRSRQSGNDDRKDGDR